MKPYFRSSSSPSSSSASFFSTSDPPLSLSLPQGSAPVSIPGPFLQFPLFLPAGHIPAWVGPSHRTAPSPASDGTAGALWKDSHLHLSLLLSRTGESGCLMIGPRYHGVCLYICLTAHLACEQLTPHAQLTVRVVVGGGSVTQLRTWLLPCYHNCIVLPYLCDHLENTSTFFKVRTGSREGGGGGGGGACICVLVTGPSGGE